MQKTHPTFLTAGQKLINGIQLYLKVCCLAFMTLCYGRGFAFIVIFSFLVSVLHYMLLTAVSCNIHFKYL